MPHDQPPTSKPPPGQPSPDRDREAAAETDAGLGIPIEDIERWVESWDTAAELPMPESRKVR
jgi:hypothetical protein